MDVLLLLIGLDLVLGGVAVFVGCRKLPRGLARAFGVSLILATFFSVSIVIDRIIVVPLPTFVVLIGLVADWYKAQMTPCVMHPSEGCVPPMNDEANSIVFIPFLIQWAIWFVLASAVEAVQQARRRKKGESDIGETVRLKVPADRSGHSDA